ncbi:unnamed protein product, partial [Didymodactylos carnosus]
MQQSSTKTKHAYRKVDDFERQTILSLVQALGNSASAIANYIRASGNDYGELGRYYQTITYNSARKRIYDILSNAAKRAQDPLCFQPTSTDAFDYVTSSDGIENTDTERDTFVKRVVDNYHAQQRKQNPSQQPLSSITLTAAVDHSENSRQKSSTEHPPPLTNIDSITLLRQENSTTNPDPSTIFSTETSVDDIQLNYEEISAVDIPLSEPVSESAPTALLTPDPVVSQPTLLTNFPLSFATSLPQIPNDILQKLP